MYGAELKSVTGFFFSFFQKKALFISQIEKEKLTIQSHRIGDEAGHYKLKGKKIQEI